MKRHILLFILSIFFTYILDAQPQYGDGSLGNPYRGTITTPWTLSGDKYCDALTVSSGTFTISAGATLRFSSGNGLTISGTGSISAIGTSASNITFTASGTSWGHIYFNSTGASILKYCIIEKGYDGTYGGGIYITSSAIEVRNCTFRNNRSPRGGGICIIGANPSVSECYFYSNNVTVDGGGIFTWGSAAVIENCLFYNNSASSNGGGAYLGNADNLKITNSTFASNSAGSTGRAIAFRYNRTPVTLPVIKNSIIWGADENYSISYSGFSKSSSIFVNSAIQGYISGYTNCIGLNASNTASDGPNFINPGPSGTIDLSIAFVSPCRDKGTGTGAPSKDYAGNNRIGQVDIGAYEHQYCRWVGGTSGQERNWNTSTNWAESILPSSAPYVVIGSATYNPLISVSDVTVQQLITEPGGDLTIGSGRLLTASALNNGGTTVFNPGAKGTIPTIVNNGTFRLESDASGIASLIVDSYSGNDAEVELYLTGGTGSNGGLRWHYISSPFNYLSVDPLTSVTLDLAQWVESMATIGLTMGWVAFDGWIYRAVPPSSDGPKFSSFQKGKGYDYYYASTHTYTLQGQFNTSDVVISIPNTDPTDEFDRYGLNLLGNPFPSGLDWDVITSSPSYPAQTSKVLHYEREEEHVYYINGIGSEEGVNGIIPPMQGFFTKTYASGNSITIPKTARTHNDIPSRYKGTTSIPHVRLKLNSGPFSDNTVIRFDYEAKAGLDYDFDAVRSFLPENKPYIYSVSEGNRYVINGLPFPEESIEIPLTVKVTESGSHTLLASSFINLDNYTVSLKDLTTGIKTNLRTTPSYTFTASAGIYDSRFVLSVSKINTSSEEIAPVNINPFRIYQHNEQIYIIPDNHEWNGKRAIVNIIDLTGRIYATFSGLDINAGSSLQLPVPQAKGIYFIEIRTDLIKYVEKIIIK